MLFVYICKAEPVSNNDRLYGNWQERGCLIGEKPHTCSVSSSPRFPTNHQLEVGKVYSVDATTIEQLDIELFVGKSIPSTNASGVPILNITYKTSGSPLSNEDIKKSDEHIAQNP